MSRDASPALRAGNELRRRAGAAGNAVIDEFCGGRIDRREFLRYLSVLGLWAPLLGCRDWRARLALPGPARP